MVEGTWVEQTGRPRPSFFVQDERRKQLELGAERTTDLNKDNTHTSIIDKGQSCLEGAGY